MGVEVKLVNTTVEVDDTMAVQNALHDQFVIAGKAAGICYGPEDYFDNGYTNANRALGRAQGALGHGHFSTFEHGHVSFYIKCSKIAAMILNSTRLYNTSEKSARYTEMTGTTDLEKTLYDKWKKIFTNLIKANKEVSPEKFLNIKSDKDIEKIAMENARYLLSISTPTQLIFTVPYGRALLLPGWINNFAYTLMSIIRSDYYKDSKFGLQMMGICFELSDISNKIRDLVVIQNEDEDDQYSDQFVPKNYKSLGIDFSMLVSYFNTYEKFLDDAIAIDPKEFMTGDITENIKRIPIKNYDNVLNYIDEWFDEPIKDNIADSYTISYECSFAALAQLERHRTLKYQFDFLKNYKESSFYIPHILESDKNFKEEWIKDCTSLNDKGVIIQANMVRVVESGHITDFFTKAKDRMCMRAQLETAELTKNTLQKFYKNISNFSTPIRHILHNTYELTLDDNGKEICDSGLRCTYSDFTCLEACPYFKKRFPDRIV